MLSLLEICLGLHPKLGPINLDKRRLVDQLDASSLAWPWLLFHQIFCALIQLRQDLCNHQPVVDSLDSCRNGYGNQLSSYPVSEFLPDLLLYTRRKGLVITLCPLQ